jgi:hypothetical protein
MENEPEIKVNLPKTEIIIGDKETQVASTKEVPVVIPAPPLHAIKDNGDIDPPEEQEIVTQIRKLTNKSVLIALEKLNKMLPSLEEKDIEKFVNITLKLMDAQMAFDWSDRYARAILKNPSLLKNLKGGGNRTSTAQGNMTKLNKLNQGDGRTTPKKLKADMPKDDDEAEAV